MAEFTYLELRKARETRFSSRRQLAEVIGVSEDTIERWETGKQLPTPEDVDRIEDAVQMPGLWHAWMCSNCDSYRKRYKGVKLNGLFSAVVSVRHEMTDVLNIQEAAERDAITGAIDDPMLRRQYRKELSELVATASAALARIPTED